MKKLLLVVCLFGLIVQGPLNAMEEGREEGRREGGGSLASLILTICTFGCLFPFVKADNDGFVGGTGEWNHVFGFSDSAKELSRQDLWRLFQASLHGCFDVCPNIVNFNCNCDCMRDCMRECNCECRARRSDFAHDMSEILKSRLEAGDCLEEDFDWENSCWEEDCMHPRSEDRCSEYESQLSFFRKLPANKDVRRGCLEDTPCGRRSEAS